MSLLSPARQQAAGTTDVPAIIMARPESYPDDLSTDPTSLLEQHLLAGFPPDLALDLVLNELVARAAESTRATAAALALSRGEDMVCRAATGPLAPELGVPLNTRDGLSGACLRTRQPQLSVDTEFDPRIDPVVSQRLGIRSILIVPIFDATDRTQFTGILEVFSSSPAAFSHHDQKLLESFADECARIRQYASELSQRKPSLVSSSQFVGQKFETPEILPAELHLAESDSANFSAPLPSVPRLAHEAWALILGALTIVAAVALSFLIGSRIGWLNPAVPTASRPISQIDIPAIPAASRKAASPKPVGSKATTAAKPVSAPNPDELIVYEKGKVVFRSNGSPKREPDKIASEKIAPENIAPVKAASEKIAPENIAPVKAASEKIAPEDIAPATIASEKVPPQNVAPVKAASEKPAPVKVAPVKIAPVKIAPVKIATANPDAVHTGGDVIVAASSTTKIGKRTGVWLTPDEAEDRLVSRVEPEYPVDALASHRSGNVVLELLVSEDGSVSSIRTVSGDPLLATAATDAIRNWHYQPYRQNERPSQFHTDVTMTFTLPN